MTKIVILVQNTVNPTYSGVDELSKTTWSKIPHPDVTVIHYYGGYNTDGSEISTLGTIPTKGNVSLNIIDGNNILVCGTTDVVHDGIDPRTEKLILAYEWCLNNLEFDYIVRICNTTYIDSNKLHKFLHSLERKERQYDGVRNLIGYTYPFCTGYFTYMSRDCTEQLVNHKEDYLAAPSTELPWLKHEDVLVGYILMYKLNYAYWDEPHKVTFYHATDGEKLVSYLENYNPTDNYNAYRFRSHTTDEYIRFHNKVLEYYNNHIESTT